MVDLPALSLMIGAVLTGTSGLLVAITGVMKIRMKRGYVYIQLARLWAWITDNGLDLDVPAGLRFSVERALDEGKKGDPYD